MDEDSEHKLEFPKPTNAAKSHARVHKAIIVSFLGLTMASFCPGALHRVPTVEEQPMRHGRAITSPWRTDDDIYNLQR